MKSDPGAIRRCWKEIQSLYETLILREALFISVSFETYSTSNGLNVGCLGFTYDPNEAIRQYLQDDMVLRQSTW